MITTDVGLCDNRLEMAPDGWGHRPQRGCLQPDAGPGTGGRKVIAATDLTDADSSNDDFVGRFGATLDNIAIYGSFYERGLDAVTLFLDPQTERHASCSDDLQTFRRENASLVVIFLTDEEDCSHGLGNSSFIGEHPEEEPCGAYSNADKSPYLGNNGASRCYQDEASLPPVELYVDALKRVDARAKVAVIAGGLGEAGNIEPAGCVVSSAGTPEGGCYESGGNSNFTDEGQTCGPEGTYGSVTIDRGGNDCCTADPGDRYYRFADLVGNKTTDSICNRSFRSTMLDIAAFIASVDFVELAEPPANPDLILVELARAEGGDVVTVPRLAPGASCATSTGWFIENDVRVVLCGSARPGPGDQVRVRAAATQAEDCVQRENSAAPQK